MTPIPLALSPKPGPGRITLMQSDRRGGATRGLWVEADGTWKCDNCTGDGKTTTGKLTTATNQEIQRLQDDPALYNEVVQTRHYRATCSGPLISGLITKQGIISTSDCPGEQQPPITAAILHLLTGETPVQIARSAESVTA